MPGNFDKKFGVIQEGISEEKKSVKKDLLKNTFHSAFTNLKNDIITTKDQIQEAKDNFENFDIDSIIKLELELDHLEKVKEKLIDLYKFEFDEDLNTIFSK